MEKLIRDNKCEHLADIDSDSCHHIHNWAKKFCEPFNGYVEKLFRDIYNDHKWSPDLRQALSEICTLLSIKFTSPDMYICWRWLSCYDVSTVLLLDAYRVLYYSFLPPEEKKLYRRFVDGILDKREVGSQARKEF